MFGIHNFDINASNMNYLPNNSLSNVKNYPIICTIHMDGCFYCQQLKPKWDNAVKLLHNQYDGNGATMFVERNCIDNLNSQYGFNLPTPASYPHIISITPSNGVYEYGNIPQETREPQDLLKFMITHGDFKKKNKKGKKGKKGKQTGGTYTPDKIEKGQELFCQQVKEYYDAKKGFGKKKPFPSSNSSSSFSGYKPSDCNINAGGNNKIGNQEFGSWKDGSSIFKDSKGYYIIQWNPTKNEEYKKYLPNWKPKQSENKLVLKNKWLVTKSKKKNANTKKMNKTKRRGKTKGGKWTLKYKKSINCKKPKGFSQKQHCKYGRKK